MVQRGKRGRCGVDAATRRGDDDSFVCAETLCALFRIAEGLSGNGNAVDPCFELAWNSEVVHRSNEHNDVGCQELTEHCVDGCKVLLKLQGLSVIVWCESSLKRYCPDVQCLVLG